MTCEPLRLSVPAFCDAARATQRRWWWDVDATKKKFDKPAFTNSEYCFVRGQVPIVLLQPVRGLGQKGQIVSVKRGYARHQLVPKGLAVFGTWENIDMYADPALVEDPSLKSRVQSARGRLPFDWVDEIRLVFVRWARQDHPTTLLEPIRVWEVLEELSEHHELDLLPGNIDVPEGGFGSTGFHEVPVRIAFRNPESAAGRYTLRVEVISRQSQEDQLRREEMAEAVAQSLRFELPQRALPSRDRSDVRGFDMQEEDLEGDDLSI